MKILEQVLNKIKLNQATKNFLLILVEGLIGITGKRTFRNLARYMEKEEHTFSRQMKKEIDFTQINAEMIKECKADDEIMFGSHDSSFMSKSGKLTYGLGLFWNACKSKVEKGLEIDLIAGIKIGKKREGFALSVEQTKPDALPEKKEKKKEKKVKKKDEVTKVDYYLGHVKKVFPRLVELFIQYMVVDAFFAKIKYVDGVCSLGLHVVSKLRKDARLRRVYTGTQKSRGRRKKFDTGKINDNDFAGAPIIHVKEDNVILASITAYSVSLKRYIKVVRAQEIIDNKIHREALLFSTNLEQDTLQIYQFYSARFQIEFIFRDAKNFTGLTDCQSRDSQRLNYHFNASLLALNVAKIQDAAWQKLHNLNIPFSMANWSRKYYLQIVLKHIISMFDFDQTLLKSHPNYESIFDFGKIHH